MDSPQSLSQLERRTYRSVFQDGLYDIQFGLLFLVLAWIPVLEYFGVSRFIGYSLFLLVIVLPWLGKRYLTLPRLGMVEFGPTRRRRRSILLAVAIGAAILMLPVVIMIGFGGLSGEFGWQLVALIALPFLVIALIAKDFPRLYVYGALLIAGVVETEFLLPLVGTPLNAVISFGLPGVIVVGYGTVLLAKFLVRYALPGKEQPHVS